MLQLLAHSPYFLMDIATNALVVVLVVLEVPLLFAVGCGLCFMVAGWGREVSWWRRILAPLFCGICLFVVLGVMGGLSVLLNSELLLWGALVLSPIVLVLSPLLLCRYLLRFGWWRSVAVSLAAPLVGALIGVGGFHASIAVLSYYIPEPAAEEMQVSAAE